MAEGCEEANRISEMERFETKKDRTTLVGGAEKGLYGGAGLNLQGQGKRGEDNGENEKPRK
jgi:hypothetical protein